MKPKDLREHKKALKLLDSSPEFKQMKRGKFPKPFKTMGSPRLFTTGLLNVSDTHCVIFIWRDGPEITDSLFLGYLFCKLNNSDLYPLFEFHLHPSHKSIHGKTPCNTESNYTNRQLPGAPELKIASKVARQLDPRSESDRAILIGDFCDSCGITIGKKNGLWNS